MVDVSAGDLIGGFVKKKIRHQEFNVIIEKDSDGRIGRADLSELVHEDHRSVFAIEGQRSL